MRFYFIIQYKRIFRIIKEAGFNPFLAFFLLVIVFTVISSVFFQKVLYAKYIYSFFSLVFINKLGSKSRNELLKNCFSVRGYRKIRIAENLIIATPFFIFLLSKQEFSIAFFVYFIAFVFSFINKVNKLAYSIPTPFYQHPFEFVVGFRKTFLVFFLSYILTYIAITVDNFNLGIFSLIVSSLTAMTFYSNPEPLFYVWIHSTDAIKFLLKKIKIACLYSILLNLPILLSLILFFPNKAYIVILFEVLGLLFVIMNLLGKYAHYPTNTNFTQGFAIGFCLFFPPLSLFVIPYFYSKSKQNLQTILK